jgi:DNA-binding YbaB/EbfC family protein
MGYGNFGGFGGGNIQNLMRQAQKMQEDMQRKRAELDAREFSASVGGGMVEIIMTGDKKVKKLSIKKEVVDPEDVEMLEDLVVSAFSDVMGQIERAERDSLPQVPGM